MTVDALLQSLHSIPGLKDTELVIHFRFATHGDKTPGNTHPFPVTNKIHMLRKVRATVDHALVHNVPCTITTGKGWLRCKVTQGSFRDKPRRC